MKNLLKKWLGIAELEKELAFTKQINLALVKRWLNSKPEADVKKGYNGPIRRSPGG